MATYWVSGVWKNNQDDITHLLVHETDDKSIYPGEKRTEIQCMQMIRGGHELKTCRYSYDGINFTPGAIIEIINSRYGQFLRTVADSKITDNLDSMIPMSMFKNV